MRTGPAALKLIAFAVISALLTLIVVNTVTRPLGTPTLSYHALFTDASGLRPGDDVDIAGVRVGKITAEKVQGADALISFELDSSQHLTSYVDAQIRYADLLGARRLSLVETRPGGTTLPPGATIPLSRTVPALSLTQLFNGFRPLFAALRPAQANQLAAEVIATLQGQAGSVQSLLRNIGTFGRTLVNRDQVIASVINNLDTVLGTVDRHRTDLVTLLHRLADLAGAVSGDRQQIAGALSGVDDLARSLTGFARSTQPSLHRDIGSLNAVTGTLARNARPLDQAVRGLAPAADALTRALGYGTWINIYVCALAVDTNGQATSVGGPEHSAVCQ